MSAQVCKYWPPGSPQAFASLKPAEGALALQTTTSPASVPNQLDWDRWGQVGTDVATEQERRLQLQGALQRKLRRKAVPLSAPPPNLSCSQDPEISVRTEARMGSQDEGPLMATNCKLKGLKGWGWGGRTEEK